MGSCQLMLVAVFGVIILLVIVYCFYREKRSLSNDMRWEFLHKYKVGPFLDEVGTRAYNLRNYRETDLDVIESQLNAMEKAIRRAQNVKLSSFYEVFKERMQNEKPRVVFCSFCRLDFNYHCKGDKETCPVKNGGYCDFETAFEKQMRLNDCCEDILYYISLVRKNKIDYRLYSCYLLIIEHTAKNALDSLISERHWRVVHSVIYNNHQLTQARK